MGLSSVQICNLALSNLGAYRIQSLTEATKEARHCNTLYEPVRDMVLRDHKWGFATKRQVLALLTETVSGWDYAYQYPSDCLIAREIYDGTGNYSGTYWDSASGTYKQYTKVEYEIASNSTGSSRMILTNKDSAELVYTAKITDTNMFDSIFVEAFALKLSVSLAVPLKAQLPLQQSLAQQYAYAISSAKAADSNEQQKDVEDSNSFVRARN